MSGHKLVGGIFLSAVALGIAVGVWREGYTVGHGADGHVVVTDGLRITSPDIRSLVQQSPVIIEGTLTSERTRTVEVPAADGSVGLIRRDLVRTLKVESVISGTVDGAAEVEVVTTVKQEYAAIGGIPAFDHSTEAVVPMVVGERYMVFLGRFPDVGGVTIFGLASDPAVAHVKDSSLEFLISSGLQKDKAAAAGALMGFKGLTRTAIADAVRDVNAP